MNEMSDVFIVIDAIEGLGNANTSDFLQGMGDIITQANLKRPNHRIRLLVSCRHEVQAKDRSASFFSLRISKSIMKNTVQVYLRDVIEDFAEQMRQFNAATTVNVRGKIAERIANGSDGMFLWAVTAWEDFKKGLLWNRDIVRRKMVQLDALPSGMYCAVRNKDERARPRDQRRRFRHLLHAVRRGSTAERDRIGHRPGHSQSPLGIGKFDRFRAISSSWVTF